MFSQKRADLTHCFRHAFARMAFADMVDQCGHSFAPHFRSNFEGNCLIGNNFGAMLIEREIDEYSCPAHGSPFGAYLEIYQRSAPDAASLGPFGSKRHSERHEDRKSTRLNSSH